jgi:hypothetical protein
MIALAWMTSMAGLQSAVQSVSESFAGFAITIEGNRGAKSRMSCFNLPVVHSLAYAGRASGIGVRALADNSAPWADDQFNGTNGAFYVEFDSGRTVDILDTGATTKTLTLAQDPPAGTTVGSHYCIRRHFTIQEIFGEHNESGLLPGSNLSQADLVRLHRAQNQSSRSLFYSSVPNYTGWYFDDYTPAVLTPIDPQQGMMVTRKSNTDAVVFVHGVARQTLMQAPVYPGFNLVGTLRSSQPLQLSQINLYTGDPTTGVMPGANPSSADNIVFLNADTGTKTFFYSNYPGYEGWFDASYRSVNQTLIAPGTAFFIVRKAPHGPFYWNIPSD